MGEESLSSERSLNALHTLDPFDVPDRRAGAGEFALACLRQQRFRQRDGRQRQRVDHGGRERRRNVRQWGERSDCKRRELCRRFHGVGGGRDQ